MVSDLIIGLKEADRVEVTTIIDNYVDVLIPSTENVKRPPLATTGEIPRTTLLAEHGLCFLIEVFGDEERHTILMDAGWTKEGVPHNLRLLGIDLEDIEAIFLSHGHMDHHGALLEVLQAIPRGEVPLVLHPNVFLTSRYIERPSRVRVRFPGLDEQDLQEVGANIMKVESPCPLASGLITTTGEVERAVPFEKGMANAYIEREGRVEPDAILDDQGLVINLKGKGLVVVSGCAHSGIINTIRHAQKIAQVDRVYAIIGGFHLTGPFFEPIIGETIDQLKKINPAMIVPAHCTGWKAVYQLAQEMPGQFVLNSVGTKFSL